MDVDLADVLWSYESSILETSSLMFFRYYFIIELEGATGLKIMFKKNLQVAMVLEFLI